MRAMAPALAVLLCCPRPAPCAEAPSAADSRRADVLKQMDKVIADPSDDKARISLDSAAGRAAALEKSMAEAERARLLAGAKKDFARLSEMQASRAARVEEWKTDFSKACDLASSAATVRRAVAAYEDLLAGFPVYSDDAGLLAESGERIRGIFFDTIKKTYPYLAVGRTTADARMLAALQFARASAVQSETGGGNLSWVTEAELKKADKLKSLEDVLQRHLENMSSGLVSFRRRRWAESVKYFDEVLAFDKANEEAIYYKGLAVSRAAAESEKR